MIWTSGCEMWSGSHCHPEGVNSPVAHPSLTLFSPLTGNTSLHPKLLSYGLVLVRETLCVCDRRGLRLLMSGTVCEDGNSSTSQCFVFLLIFQCAEVTPPLDTGLSFPPPGHSGLK